MIFSPENASKIVAGNKSQTRRLVKFAAGDKGGELRWDKNARAHRQKIPYVSAGYPGPKVIVPCRYAVNGDYSLQRGYGKPGDPNWRLFILAVEGPERAEAITDQDAVLEGYEDREAFLADWDEINGEGKRDQLVWVITFKPVLADRPRLLRATPPVGRPRKDRDGNVAQPDKPEIAAARISGAYTESHVAALDGEKEAVNDEDLDDITTKANERWEEYMETERATELDAQKARRLVKDLGKMQADAARYGIRIVPSLERMAADLREQIKDGKRAQHEQREAA